MATPPKLEVGDIAPVLQVIINLQSDPNFRSEFYSNRKAAIQKKNITLTPAAERYLETVDQQVLEDMMNAYSNEMASYSNEMATLNKKVINDLGNVVVLRALVAVISAVAQSLRQQGGPTSMSIVQTQQIQFCISLTMSSGDMETSTSKEILLSAEKTREAIDKISEIYDRIGTTQRNLLVGYGEPFLNYDALIKTVEFATSRGMNCIVLSYGKWVTNIEDARLKLNKLIQKGLRGIILVTDSSALKSTDREKILSYLSISNRLGVEFDVIIRDASEAEIPRDFLESDAVNSSVISIYPLYTNSGVWSGDSFFVINPRGDVYTCEKPLVPNEKVGNLYSSEFANHLATRKLR